MQGTDWQIKTNLKSDVLQWSSDMDTLIQTETETYIHQPCMDTWECLEKFSIAMAARGRYAGNKK